MGMQDLQRFTGWKCETNAEVVYWDDQGLFIAKRSKIRGAEGMKRAATAASDALTNAIRIMNAGRTPPAPLPPPVSPPGDVPPLSLEEKLATKTLWGEMQDDARPY
jgi:hypothetical protein